MAPTIVGHRRPTIVAEAEFSDPTAAGQIETTVLAATSPIPRRVVAWMQRDLARLADAGTAAEPLRTHTGRETEALLAAARGPLSEARFPAEGPLESLHWPADVGEVDEALDRLDAVLLLSDR